MDSRVSTAAGKRRPRGRAVRWVGVLTALALIATLATIAAPTAQAQELEQVVGTVLAGGEPLPDVAVFTIATDELGVTTGPAGDFAVPTVPAVDDDWTVAALQSTSTPRFIAPFVVDSTAPPVELTLPAIELVEVTLTGGPWDECEIGSLDPRCETYRACILDAVDTAVCDESEVTFLSPAGLPSPPDAIEWQWTGTTVDNRVVVPTFAGTTASISVLSPGGPTQQLLWDASAAVQIELERAWFRDGDGDGFGTQLEVGLIGPEAPGADYVDNRADCDDLDPAVSPAAAEVPGNDVDENCDGEVAPAVAVDVSVQVFAVAGLEEACLDPFAAFEAGEPINDAPTVVGELGLVAYCVIVTNNDAQQTIDFVATTDPPLEFIALTPGQQDLLPGSSALVAATTSVDLDTAPFTVTVTSTDPTQQFEASATTEVEVRRVLVTVGDYVIDQVDEIFDIVLEIDATLPVGATIVNLSYDPAVIQPVSDGVGPRCTLIAAVEMVCSQVAQDTLQIGGATLDPAGWIGPTRVLSVQFVAIEAGTTDLDLSGVDGFDAEFAGVQPPGFALNERFGGLTIDGSVLIQPPTDWYLDADGDNFGAVDADAVTAYQPPGDSYADNNEDCDDLDPTVSPAAIELLGNEVDENCDGSFGGLGVLLGDVSCDGRLGIADAVLIAQYIVALRDAADNCPADLESSLFLAAGDLNDNGVVSIADAVVVAQCIAGVDNGYCPTV